MRPRGAMMGDQESSSGPSGYYQRREVAPHPGTEAERWPKPEDNALFRQNASETAKALGLEGVKKETLFGRRGEIEQLILARTARRIAEQRRLDVERAKL